MQRNAESMALNVGLRDTFASVRLRDDCPFEAAALEGGVAAVLLRAQEAGVLRQDLTAADFQALMCGLSATISAAPTGAGTPASCSTGSERARRPEAGQAVRPSRSARCTASARLRTFSLR